MYLLPIDTGYKIVNKYQMSYTNLVALANTANSFPLDANVSDFDQDHDINFTVTVRRPNSPKDLADQIIAKKAVPISRDDFTRMFAASQSDLDQVAAFASYHDMTVVSSHADRATVKIKSRMSVVNRAFAIDIKKITKGDKVDFAHEQPISVPEELLDIIDHVQGLNSLIKISKQLKFISSAPGNQQITSDLTPLRAAKAYNFPQNLLGQGQCVGIISYGGGYNVTNLDKSFLDAGVINAPKIVNVFVDGAVNQTYSQANPDTDNYSVENALDIFVVGCVVPKAVVAVYFQGSNVAGLPETAIYTDVLDAAIHDTVNNPSVINISWAFVENDLSDTFVRAYEYVLAQAVILGITVCVASGDYGSSTDIVGSFGVYYPASSAYVLAVGGTSLTLNTNGTVLSENAWALSGGGLSLLFGTPDWQQGLYYTQATLAGAGNPYLLSDGDQRGVPDVAAPADPDLGYTLYSYYYDADNDVWYDSIRLQVGGTSAAAPLIAALVAQLNQHFNQSLGFVNPIFYSNANSFNDIDDGTINNQYDPLTISFSTIGYQTTAGWDAVTGLGSPQGTALLTSISIIPTAPNLSVSTNQNQPVIITPLLSTAVIKIAITTNPQHGVATVDITTKSITYTPTMDYFGTDNFLYVVSTPFHESSPGVISVNIGSLLPVANTVTTVVLANSGINTIIPIVTNFYDRINIYSSVGTEGTVTATNKLLYYTPAVNYVGTDTFFYSASSPTGTSNPAPVFVTVPKPPAPIAYDLLRTVVYNSINNIINPNVTGFYGLITLTSSTSLRQGLISVVNNHVIYNTPSNYVGKDSFKYIAVGPGGVSTATVLITVLTTGSAFVAYNVSQYVQQNSQNNIINLSNTNSTGTVSVTSTATKGVATVTNKVLYYTPNVNYVGFDHFAYKITNNYGTSTSATVNISVNSTNYVPVLFASSATLIENSINNILIPLVTNTVSGITVNSQPIFGVATANTATITYTPNVGFIGQDYFYFSAYNTAGLSESKKFSITVLPLLTPTAQNTASTVAYNSVNNIIRPKVLNPFNTTTVITLPLHGVATSSNTLIYYTPTSGYSGTDTFLYQVGNIRGISNTAKVSITVRPSLGFSIYPPAGNLPRGFANTAYQPLTFLGVNGTAPFVTSVTAGVLPDGISLVNNVLSGTPNANSVNEYQFVITMTDSSTPTNLTSSATYYLSITGTTNQLITASGFNSTVIKANNLISQIYGVESFSTSVNTSTSIVLALDWDRMFDDVRRAFIHQQGPTAPFNYARPIIGTFVSLGLLNSFTNILNVLTASYTKAHPSQLLLDTPNVITTSTTTAVLQTFVINYDWPTANDTKYFFNLGGYIRGSVVNPVTQAQTSTVFTLSNYMFNLSTTSTSSLAVINGIGSSSIINKSYTSGSTVISTFQIKPNSGSTATMTFTATDYYSTDITGGILAPRPLVQQTLINGELSTASVPLTLVKGNEITVVNLALANTNPNAITLTSANITSQTASPLTVTYPNLPLTIPGNSTGTLQINLQNFTALGGNFDINFVIQAFINVNSTVILLNAINLTIKVSVQFGITVTPSSISGTVTKPQNYSFVITGYGAVMNAIDLSNANFNVISYTFDTVGTNSPKVARVNTTFNTDFAINGVYTTALKATGSTGATSAQVTIDTSQLTVSVTDKNLGTWISGFDANNAIMGFSYDVLNGIPTLTMGFGSQPSDSNAVQYLVPRSVKTLGRKTYHFNNARTYAVSWVAFLNTYGVTAASGISASFFVRYSGTFTWEVAANSNATLVINGQTVFNSATNPAVSYTGNVNLTSGYNTVSVNNATSTHAVGARITYTAGLCAGYDAWSTLDYAVPSWVEITRIPFTDSIAKSYIALPNIYGGTFSKYFKNSSGTEGMVTVDNDGFGKLLITTNPKSSNSGDATIDRTLNNVPDLIYYYSGITDRTVSSNLESAFGNNQTHTFLGFNANGTVITGTASAPIQPPAPSGGGGSGGGGGGGDNYIIPILIIIGISTGWICFKKNTKIQMSNGKTKDIGNIEIGDYVYNYNKTSINQVRFIIRSKLNGKLYSPNSEIEPFGSKNHPLISESGDIISYDSHYCNKNYHWLGTCKQIEPVSSCEVEDEIVYNILVDGDGTYTVNGIGTTSVIGDGGAVINCVDNKLITEQQAMEFLKYIHDRAGIALYIWYKINKVLAKTTNQILLKFYANTIKFIIKNRNII